MAFNLRREVPILTLVILPFIYLAYIWNSLPEKVPVHWNFKGEVDRWGSKEEIMVIPFLLPVLIYIIFLIVPKIDPKNKIEKMGNKFHHLKFVTVALMSALAIFIIYSVQSQTVTNVKIVYVMIGFLFIVLGNYFKTLKPNYFIGIRTPWTLENETVWKETHRMGGKLWFFGGFLVILGILVLPAKSGFVFFLAAVLLLAIIPIVFSYLRYKALKENV